jgi:hypothetical protein
MQKPIILLLSLISAFKALNLDSILKYMKNQPINKVYPNADGTKYIKLETLSEFSRWDEGVYAIPIYYSVNTGEADLDFIRVIKLFT